MYFFLFSPFFYKIREQEDEIGPVRWGFGTRGKGQGDKVGG
jgi:hypothetical protein